MAHLPFKRLARPDEESGVGKMQAACKCRPSFEKAFMERRRLLRHLREYAVMGRNF